MNHEEFVRGMTILKEAFPSRKINAKVYFTALEDLTGPEFLASVLKIVQKTAKLYQDDNLIAMIRENVEGSVRDLAELAWTKARTGIITAGAYRTVTFDDPVINGVIEAIGGWEKFCGMEISEEPFRKKDFLSLYESISKTGRECPGKLVGYCERVNGHEEAVKFIGDKKVRRIAIGSQNIAGVISAECA